MKVDRERPMEHHLSRPQGKTGGAVMTGGVDGAGVEEKPKKK